MYTTNHVELEELVEEVITTKKTNNLVLFNDDFNTFDHVIQSLVSVCNHNPIQAEQCTLIVHNNGKCIIKVGSYRELEKMKYALQDRELTVEIQ
jgi:ATP-dependent Clp protease adaptor protein ClpS